MSTAIKIENVSKMYRLGEVGTGTIRDDFARAWAKLRGKEDPFQKVGVVNRRDQATDDDYVWALHDINFEVEQGEVLGIIGRNGAGKSTLLKLLSRITAPTTGRIRARGRIASLLEVGTGFHPELTGRENVYLNGALLGMTRREVTRRLDDIVAFSGCAQYIDTPVKRYSSGMMVRLGFSVAAHLDCEILVVDEVLAVGDLEFQKKCMGKMGTVAAEGRTILFVSHNLSSLLKLCHRGVLLQHGGVHFDGPIISAVNEYVASAKNRHIPVGELPVGDNEVAQITHFEILDSTGEPTAAIQLYEQWTIRVSFTLRSPLQHVILAAAAITPHDVPIITQYSIPMDLQSGAYYVEFVFDQHVSKTELTFHVGLSSQERTLHYLEYIGRLTVLASSTERQPIRAEGVGVLLPIQQVFPTRITNMLAGNATTCDLSNAARE